jgi:hypothetical protein
VSSTKVPTLCKGSRIKVKNCFSRVKTR